MTDVEKDIQQAYDLIGRDNNYFISVWNEFAGGWDGMPCSEIACCISYLAGNLNKIAVSNYAQGLINLFRAGVNGTSFGNTPRLGAFIWFDYGDEQGASHTGRVVAIDSTTVYTVEGNVWVGGINKVAQLSYPINSPLIYGYGYPNYDNQQVDSYSIRNTSPAGQYLPYYMTISENGYNSSIIGNSQDGLGVVGANVLNNCVGYSQGRLMEMHDQLFPNNQISASNNPYSIFNANAENWYSIAVNNNFQVGQTPNYGAVGVYTNGSIGHVVNVEDYQNGIWYISEGHWNYGGLYGSWDYSELDSNYIPLFLSGDSSWRLIGFIYPFSGATPTPPIPPYDPSKWKKKMPLWMKIRYFRI